MLYREDSLSFRPKRPLGTWSGEIYSKADFPSGLSASLRVSTRLRLARNDNLCSFPQSKMKRLQPGLTLIEITVVIVAAALLMSLGTAGIAGVFELV